MSHALKVAWWVCIDQQKLGPILTDTVAALVRLKRIQPTELVWHGGMKEWRAVKDCPEFSESLPRTEATPRTEVVACMEGPPAEAILRQVELPAAVILDARAQPGTPPRRTGDIAYSRVAPPDDDALRAYQESVRRHRRAPVHGQLLTSDNKTYEVVNLSEGGVLVKAAELPEVGMILDFTLHADELGSPMEITAEVARLTDTTAFKGFGLQILTIEDGDLDRIKQFIDRVV